MEFSQEEIALRLAFGSQRVGPLVLRFGRSGRFLGFILDCTRRGRPSVVGGTPSKIALSIAAAPAARLIATATLAPLLRTCLSA